MDWQGGARGGRRIEGINECTRSQQIGSRLCLLQQAPLLIWANLQENIPHPTLNPEKFHCEAILEVYL